MLKYKIQGPTKLKGEVTISGAKNSILALMAATLLARDEFVIHNVPVLRDIVTMQKVLEVIGAKVRREGSSLYIDTRGVNNYEAPYELVSQMRASIYVLGPLLARYGECKVSMPGGCAWGPRPINFHIDAMKKLGAEISVEFGFIQAKASKLRGEHIIFDFVSVGATANTMMAATLAEGTTIIDNAASEPEIVDLVNFLRKMGAKIKGEGTRTIVVEGVENLHGVEYTAIPDRIEAGTFLVAGFMTGGDILVRNLIPEHLTSVIEKLEEAGAEMKIGKDYIRIKGEGNINPIKVITAPYPGFPTDMQAQFMAMLTIANGTSSITEGIYHDRFMHVLELMRLGANIELEKNVAIIHGVNKLTGAKLMASDLRASAALVLAGLVAEGETIVDRIYHIERGYEDFDKKLQNLGAIVEKFDE